MKKLLPFIALSFLVLIIVSACSDASEDETGNDTIDTIKIGVLYPTSGEMASAGQDQTLGIEFATKLVNESHDLDIPLAAEEGLPNFDDAKIELITADTEGEPEVALGEAERLITEENVVALIGSYASSNTAAASQAAERHGVPFINVESTQRDLTERDYDWFFRTMPHDFDFTENLFSFYDDLEEEKDISVETIASTYENTQFGEGSNEAQIHFAEETKREVVEDIPYASETTDVTSEVLKIKDADPDVLMMTSYVNDAVLFQQTFKQQDYLPEAIIGMEAGHVDKDYVGNLGEDAEYIMTSATWSKDLMETKPIVNEVNELFKEEHDRDLAGYIPQAISGMMVVADAINRSESLEPEDIRDALLDTDYDEEHLVVPWDGVQFNEETHQNELGSNLLLQIIDGEYRLVWPFDLAAEELKWPMPSFEER